MTHPDVPWLFTGWWFPAFFAISWVVVCGLLSVLGGWYSLSRVLAGRLAAVTGKSYFQSGSLGRSFFPVNYGSVLFVKVGPAGIELSVLWLFRIWAPPMVIPWELVQSLENLPWWRFGGVRIRLRGHWSLLTLRGKAARLVRETYAEREH